MEQNKMYMGDAEYNCCSMFDENGIKVTAQ